MGDLGAVEGNGVGMEERLGINNPDPSTISDDQWAVAEEATEEVINSVHPTLDSEENRKDIIDYVQRLIRFSLGFEVFPYGSVPLRTYLPDGDIDLTVLSNSCAEESWASDVLFVLQAEENNENAEYEVKDTHFIDAEVKLVKCLIQNIVIDISFNQLGGICTLCFLEQVDRIVGKNHLFKRSIILIKTWCYYESRILGAHHGLISTYAMETLVLYIFNLFHSSLNGPLAVLYRFLDYFSKFDWENYCISLNGPVPKYSSLPDIVVEMPKNEADDLMLSKEFMRNSIEIFTIPSRDSETSRAFCPKFLNIIDPLKEYNNLGRSVHRGNFYRIRSAFKYGARKLGQILSLPREEIADEIKTFFSNTLQSLSWKDRSDIHDYALPYGAGGLGAFDPFCPGESFSVDDMLPKSSTGDFENDGLADSLKVFSSQTIAENSYSFDYSAVAGHGLNGDDFDLPAYSSADFRTSNGTSECSPSGNYSGSFLSKSSTENGHFSQSNPSDGVEEKQDLVPLLEDKMYDLGMVNTYTSCDDNWDSFCSFSSAASSPKTSVMESLSLDFRERDSASDIDAEPLNPLADLSGDYDSNIRSLLYGQCCHGYTLSALGLPDSPASLSQLQSKQPWDTAYQSRPLRSLSFSQMNSSAVEQPARITRSNSVFVSEERHRGRGTGTYLPVMNSFGTDRTSQGRMRNKSSGQLQRQTHSNGFVPAFSETNASRRGIREITSACDPGQTRKKSSAIRQSYHPMESDVHSNGYSNSSRRIEFGSLGHLAVVGGSNSSTSSDKPTSASELIKGEERVTNKSFHLKNEAEFPPLSV